MKYQVVSRTGFDGADEVICERFKNRNDIHELSDSDVVELIVKIGRATITEASLKNNNIRQLEFEEDYD